MAGSLKTEAIVLRSMRYGEADRILHLFTPDRGRLSAIAKGVRRAKSRFGGRLEPYFRLQLVLYQGRSDLLTVTSAETRRAAIRGCASTAPRSTAPPGRATRSRGCSTTATPHRGVYHLLANQLALLDADPARATRGNALAFRLKLLLAAGFAPQLAACAGCGEARAPRRLLRRGRRRRVLGLRGERVRARPGRARLPGRRARPPAGRGARTPRRARSRRPSGRSSRRSSTTRTCGCAPTVRVSAGRHVAPDFATDRPGRPRGASEWGVSAPAVDPAFAARIRAWEEEALSPRARALLPGRARAAGGGLRAAHAVPARPRPDRALQGVPPAQAQDAGVRRAGGRPLPHAAHPHARDDADLAHGRARAAAQRGPDGGDRARARPRPPAVRPHRRGRARPRGRERFGRGFRHNEHSLRVVEVIEDLNLTAPVRDGILRHSSGAGEPATLEGRIVRLVDRIAYINHDIDDALRAGRDRARRPARRARSRSSGRPARAGSTRSCTTSSSTPSAPGDIVQGEPVGAAMLRLRTFMFDRVYLGPTARAEHAKIERVLRGLFDWFVRASRRAAAGRRGRVGGRPRRRLPRRHDRPLRPARLGATGSSRGPRAS